MKAARKTYRIPLQTTQAQRWFLVIGGQEVGPLTSQELRLGISQEQLSPDTLVQCEGYNFWTPAYEVLLY